MPNQTITSPKGFRVAAVKAGIKVSGNLDLGLIVADRVYPTAAMFTTNKVVGPAVVVSRENVRSGRAQAVYVNAGNANTCTGRRGQRDVRTICREVGRHAHVTPDNVLVCSTGVIGHFLPMDKVRRGITEAAENLSRSAGSGRDFAKAIMTTDTKVKMAYRPLKLNRQLVQIAGTAKGSGMIAPNMATMLAFITTDVDISPLLLRRALKQSVRATFNKVTIDNHMSTSDTVIAMASGAAANRRITSAGAAFDRFSEAMWEVCDDLARQMAADGEGATCAITVTVNQAASQKQACSALHAIVDSPLVRTAFNGADPNWGRIISAVGYSGAKFDEAGLSCRIAGTTVYRHGRPCRFDARRLSRKMKAKQWHLEVDLGAGTYSDFCYTCDLSRAYVTINADYHT